MARVKGDNPSPEKTVFLSLHMPTRVETHGREVLSPNPDWSVRRMQKGTSGNQSQALLLTPFCSKDGRRTSSVCSHGLYTFFFSLSRSLGGSCKPALDVQREEEGTAGRRAGDIPIFALSICVVSTCHRASLGFSFLICNVANCTCSRSLRKCGASPHLSSSNSPGPVRVWRRLFC